MDPMLSSTLTTAQRPKERVADEAALLAVNKAAEVLLVRRRGLWVFPSVPIKEGQKEKDSLAIGLQKDLLDLTWDVHETQFWRTFLAVSQRTYLEIVLNTHLVYVGKVVYVNHGPEISVTTWAGASFSSVIESSPVQAATINILRALANERIIR